MDFLQFGRDVRPFSETIHALRADRSPRLIWRPGQRMGKSVGQASLPVDDARVFFRSRYRHLTEGERVTVDVGASAMRISKVARERRLARHRQAGTPVPLFFSAPTQPRLVSTLFDERARLEIVHRRSAMICLESKAPATFSLWIRGGKGRSSTWISPFTASAAILASMLLPALALPVDTIMAMGLPRSVTITSRSAFASFRYEVSRFLSSRTPTCTALSRRRVATVAPKRPTSNLSSDQKYCLNSGGSP